MTTGKTPMDECKADLQRNVFKLQPCSYQAS